MPKKSLDDLVNTFAENVAAQDQAIRDGEHRQGNRCAKAYLRAFQDLRARGDDGREALAGLLDDQREPVRAMAAAFLLRYRTSRAEAVLREIAAGTGMTAFGAQEALKRWREGSWALDPPDTAV